MARTPLTWSHVKIGLLVTVALTLVTVAILNMGHGLRFFGRQVQLHALVDHSQGLKVGGPVRINGVDVGNVRSVNIAEQRQLVEIVFAVHRSLLSHLHADATVAVKPLGLLGDKFLDLSPGSPSKPPLTEDDVLMGRAEGDVTGLALDAGATLERLNTAIEDLQRILAAVRDGEGTASKLLNNPSLYDRGQRVLERLETASEKGIGVLEKVERGEGTLGRLVSDPDFYRRATRAVSDLSQLAARLNNQDGTLVKLADPALYDRIESLTTRGEQLLGKLESGEGTIGKLVTEDDLYTRADRLLTDLEGLVKDVKEHPTRYFKFSLF